MSTIEDTTKVIAADRPQTGDEYIESLRDGREVWINGERVKDVTTHPAFRNSVRSIARMYDALSDPAKKDKLLVPTDTGNGGLTHPFFKMSKTSADLHQAKTAIETWQKEVYGWMGRSPDYKAAFLGTLGANSEFYGEYAGNAKDYYRYMQERILYSNHAIVHPPIDRGIAADDPNNDVCVRVVKETDNGLIVSGAKVVATGSAITQECFVAHYGLPVKKKEFGIVFSVPTGSKGVKLVSRASYELKAAVSGSPFDYPLSSRYDENDAILILDKVLVPWERVFMYDAEAANNFMMASGFLPRFTFHGCIRLGIKLDFITGCLLRAVEMKGTQNDPGTMRDVGEVLCWRNMFKAIAEAMASDAQPWVGDTVQPNAGYGLAYRTFMGTGYPRVREIIEQTLGSALIYLNSSADDFKNPELRPFRDQYVKGSDGIAAIDRVKLLKLLWDAVGSEFAGRHDLYERNYGGDHDAVRAQTFMFHKMTGEVDMLKGFAEDAMKDYDIDGWTAPDMINNDDVKFVLKQD
jgi:4-hydroxyphenylacetate 3-monooxygenase